MSRILAIFMALIIGALFVVSCSEDSGNKPADSDTGTLVVHLTDAPSDYLSSAEVTVTHVYLMVDDDDSTEAPEDSTEAQELPPVESRVDLYGPDGDPLAFNLLELRDGIEAFLAEHTVEEGTYRQLRLVVEDAVVTLAEGYMFRDSTTTAELKTPSAHQSGIKVQLVKPIDIEADTATLIVVDFDVDENFKFQGNVESPSGIKGVLFTPTLKEKRREKVDEEE